MIFQKINNKKGFDLLELMIVIAIVGILSTIFIPMFCSDSAKTTIEVITQQEEKVVNQKTQPVPKQKEVKKQKEGMTKL